jgi:hypothetical protein
MFSGLAYHMHDAGFKTPYFALVDVCARMYDKEKIPTWGSSVGGLISSIIQYTVWANGFSTKRVFGSGEPLHLSARTRADINNGSVFYVPSASNSSLRSEGTASAVGLSAAGVLIFMSAVRKLKKHDSNFKMSECSYEQRCDAFVDFVRTLPGQADFLPPKAEMNAAMVTQKRVTLNEVERDDDDDDGELSDDFIELDSASASASDTTSSESSSESISAASPRHDRKKRRRPSPQSEDAHAPNIEAYAREFDEFAILNAEHIKLVRLMLKNRKSFDAQTIAYQHRKFVSDTRAYLRALETYSGDSINK